MKYIHHLCSHHTDSELGGFLIQTPSSDTRGYCETHLGSHREMLHINIVDRSMAVGYSICRSGHHMYLGVKVDLTVGCGQTADRFTVNHMLTIVFDGSNA